jgi:hypothetical protein
MEILVIGIVFTVPQAFREEYAAAKARLNGGKATDSFMAAQQSSQTLQQRVCTLLYAGERVELTAFF